MEILPRPPGTKDERQWQMWFEKIWRTLSGTTGRITSPIAIGGQTSYILVEEDGTVVSYGDATTFDDVYPSSVAVGVGGTAPTFSAYAGNLKAYEFTGGVSNKELQIGWQLYHSYKEDSDISPHLHLYFVSGVADAGKTIIFNLEYDWANIGDTGTISTTTITGTYTIPSNSTTYKNVVFSFNGVPGTPIIGTGKKISSVFMTRLVRRQDLDSFTSSVWLKSADIHIEQNTRGSRQVLVK
jgi:hypothetical protein